MSDNLGRLYREQARFEESLALHQKALQINRELLGDAHIVVAQNYNRIALVHKESGNIEAAETEFRRAAQDLRARGYAALCVGRHSS
ncbi:MAG: tetratricopeptide repeat protein [Woeseiaceae bacterium]|nr:tetratricopeptide repeat protein [Woeseiaceae bacterium]